MNFEKIKIAVIGLGYIGLPTAAILATRGFKVNGVDTNINIVNSINNSKPHIFEPNLNKVTKHAISSGNLRAYKRVQSSEVYMICVPTPFLKKIKTPTPNMKYVFKAVDSIIPILKENDLIILESTSPIGTMKRIQKKVQKKRKDLKKIFFAYCPERVLPGNILNELIDNDRVVGGVDKESTKIASSFYRSFVSGQVYQTNSDTSEMCKLVENSYRDINIAFANELSIISEKSKVNVWELIDLANKHPRVNILKPGVGVGGHCIAVDPWFLVDFDKKNSKLIRAARTVNDLKPQQVIKKIIHKADIMTKKLKRRVKISCLGLTFKPDIDDLRGSPALKIAQKLNAKKFNIICVEPNIESYSNIRIEKLTDALKYSDIVVILVAHKEFKTKRIKMLLSKLNVLDFTGTFLTHNE